MKTIDAYEARKLTKDQIIAELEASFANLHAGLPTTDANLNENIKFFGQDISRQSAVIGTVNHLHEHLGQLIAYARINKVTPPWSR
jgi:chromosomal replication initiation ATPase DnaA